MENQKTWIYVALGLTLAFLFYNFVLKPKKEEVAAANAASNPLTGGDYVSKFKPPTEEELCTIFQELINCYGPTIAKKIEQIYRLETAHFTSEQYLASGSPGMLSFDEDYPYGWESPKNLWDNEPNMRPIGTVKFTKGGKVYTYLVFPTFIAAASAVGEHITKYNPGRWNTTDPIGQQEYINKLNTISTKYT